jgi:hypothetical protein
LPARTSALIAAPCIVHTAVRARVAMGTDSASACAHAHAARATTASAQRARPSQCRSQLRAGGGAGGRRCGVRGAGCGACLLLPKHQRPQQHPRELLAVPVELRRLGQPNQPPQQPCPGVFILNRGNNRRDIGKYQSKWTAEKMETPGSRSPRILASRVVDSIIGTSRCTSSSASPVRSLMMRRRQ